MSSSFASTFSLSATPKASKNSAGLALILTEASQVLPSKNSATFQRLSPTHSPSHMPELEPDWNSDDDCGDDDDAQYVYIYADSPFYRGPSSLRTSSHISFSGFPFACDALAEEDPLFFADSPDALFDTELSFESSASNIHIVVVDADLAKDMDSRSSHHWNLMELHGSLDVSKQDRTTSIETIDETRQCV